MAPTQRVLRVWQAVIGRVKGLTSVMDVEDETLRNKQLRDTLIDLENSMGESAAFPQVHKACCERLVLQMKVPLVITETCCSLLSRSDSISLVMTDLLWNFLGLMRQSLPADGADTPTELATEIDRQLQEGGLYKHLQQLLTDVTEQLVSAAPSDKLLLQAYFRPTRQLAFHDPQRIFADMIFRANYAMEVYCNVLCLWPEDSTPAAWDPAIDVAAVSLALTAAKQVSKWLDALPADSLEPCYVVLSLLKTASRTTTQCAARRANDPAPLQLRSKGRQPRFAPLLQSQQLLPALCFATLYSTQASVIEAEIEAARSSKVCSSVGKGQAQGSKKKGKKGSSRAARSAGSSDEAPDDDWAAACRHAEQLSSAQRELLQVLGCSGKALMFSILSEMGHVESECMSDVRALGVVLGQLQQAEAQSAHRPSTKPKAEVQQQSLRLLALLPGVLLPWVTNGDETGVRLAYSCGVAAVAINTAVQIVSGHCLQPSEGPGAEQMGVEQQQQLQRILPELLPALDTLLTTARSSTSTAVSAAGRPNSSVSIQEQIDAENNLFAAIWMLSGILLELAAPVETLPVVQLFTWYEQQVPTADGSASSCSTALQHPWQPHASKVMAVLENLVRLKPDTGVRGVESSPGMPVANLASLCAVGDRAQPGALAAAAIAAGPGSTEQRRLFGLLCSILKRSCMLGPTQQTHAEECRLAVASTAARLAQLATEPPSSTSSPSSTTAAAASSGGISCVSDLLPWLVLLGRCCLLWCKQLQWRHKGIEGMPDAAAVPQDPVGPDSIMGRLNIQCSSDVFFSLDSKSEGAAQQPLMSLLLAAVQTPLQDAGVSAQMSALGLDAGALLSKVVACMTAIDTGSADKPDGVLAAVKNLGNALCSLPQARACNYAACPNMSGASEVQLVQGNNRKCSGCRTARYCGRECQTKDWKVHKPVCKALAAAAAAAASVPAS